MPQVDPNPPLGSSPGSCEAGRKVRLFHGSVSIFLAAANGPRISRTRSVSAACACSAASSLSVSLLHCAITILSSIL